MMEYKNVYQTRTDCTKNSDATLAELEAVTWVLQRIDRRVARGEYGWELRIYTDNELVGYNVLCEGPNVSGTLGKVNRRIWKLAKLHNIKCPIGINNMQIEGHLSRMIELVINDDCLRIEERYPDGLPTLEKLE